MLTRFLVFLLFVWSVPALHAAVSSGGDDVEQQRLAAEAARTERQHAVTDDRIAMERANAQRLAQEQQLLDLRKAPMAQPETSVVAVSPTEQRKTGLLVFGGIVLLITAAGVAAAIVARRQIAERDRVRRMIRHIPLAPSILMLNHLDSKDAIRNTTAETSRDGMGT